MMANSDSRDRAHQAKGGGRHDSPLDDRFPVDLDTPIELTVQNGSGEVTVRATDRADVRIRSERSGRSDRGGRLDINVADNRITVNAGAGPSFDLGLGDLARDITKGILGRGEPGRRPEEDTVEQPWASGPRSRGGGRFDILIEIPLLAIRTVAQLRTASGELRVEGLVGEVNAHSASGEVSLRRLNGSVSAQTASGGIEITEVEGQVRVRSASGDVQIGRSDLERCTVQTASGDIRLERTRFGAAGSVKIDSVSGDADLSLGLSPVAGELGAVLEAKTVSGDLDVAPPLVKVGKRTWQVGPGGEGCLRIETRSVSGDLNVNLALDVAESPLPPGPARRPRPPRDERDHRSERMASESGVVLPVPPVPPVPPAPPVASFPFAADFDDADREVTAIERDVNRVARQAERDARQADREVARALRGADREVARARREADRIARDAPRQDHSPVVQREGGDGWSDDSSVQSPLPPIEVAETADPVRDGERFAILTALEQGEIDIDEAMRRLEPLGGETTDPPANESPDER